MLTRGLPSTAKQKLHGLAVSRLKNHSFTTKSKLSCKQQVLLGFGTSGAKPVSAIGVGPAKKQQVPVFTYCTFTREKSGQETQTLRSGAPYCGEGSIAGSCSRTNNRGAFQWQETAERNGDGMNVWAAPNVRRYIKVIYHGGSLSVFSVLQNYLPHPIPSRKDYTSVNRVQTRCPAAVPG